MSLDLGAIGVLNVLIGGDTSELVKALKEADKMVEMHSGSMRDAVNTTAKWTAGIAAAGAAIVAGLVVKSLEAIDAQAKLGRQLRATSEGLSTLARAATLAGIEKEAMTSAVRKLDVAMGQASMRNEEYSRTFERLHLNVEQLSKMDADKRILTVNDAIRQYIPETERAAVATQLFSRRMGSAIAALNGEDIKTAAEEVKKLGLAVNEVDATTIERVNDQFSALQEVAHGAANRLAVLLAPALDDVIKRIRQAALDSNGFKDTIEGAFKRAVEGVAFFLDAMRGLQVVVKIAELTFQALAHGALAAFAVIVKGYTELANLLPGVDINFDETFLGVLLNQSSERIKETRKELVDLTEKEMPGQGFIKWLETAKKASDAVSKEIIKTRKVVATGGQAPMTEEEKKRIQAIREALSTQEEVEGIHHKKMLEDLKKLHKDKLLAETDYNDLVEREGRRHDKAMADIYNDKNAPNIAFKQQKLKDFQVLQDSLTDEAILEQKAYEEKLAALDTAHTDEMTSDEEHKALLQEAERQHWANIQSIREQSLGDLTKFTKWTFTDQTNHVLGELANLTSGAAQQNRAMFEANKVFGIASAIVNAYVGISKTLSTYPYPLNIAMAAGHAIAAFAQVNAIRSASFGGGGGGGGGSAPSIAGSTPAAPVSPVSSGSPAAQNNQSTIVNLNGDFFSRKQIRSLLDSLNENGRDGGKIFIG